MSLDPQPGDRIIVAKGAPFEGRAGTILNDDGVVMPYLVLLDPHRKGARHVERRYKRKELLRGDGIFMGQPWPERVPS